MPRPESALPALFLVLLLALPPARAEDRSLRLDSGETVSFRLVTDDAQSVRPVAMRLLGHLAAGEIEQAAKLSNAPERRGEVLRDYLASVGEAEFRRIFADYASRRVLAEVAIGERRLLVWALGEHLAGQYFVRTSEGFVLDDAPNEERLRLQRVLAAYRAGRIKP